MTRRIRKYMFYSTTEDILDLYTKVVVSFSICGILSALFGDAGENSEIVLLPFAMQGAKGATYILIFRVVLSHVAFYF